MTTAPKQISRSIFFFPLLAMLMVPILACTFAEKAINIDDAPGSAQISEIQWETYTDQVNRFSINHPSTWFYFRSGGSSVDPTKGNFLLFSSALGNTDIQNRSEDEEARLIVNTLPNNNGTNLDDWLTGSPLLQEDITRVDVNGIEAIRIVTPPENEIDHSTHIFLFLATPNRLYSLIGVISVSENTEFWYNTIIQMQNSFLINE